MPTDVYIDLYFLTNAGMDLLCLTLCAFLLHRRVRRLRALLAAAFGGVYASAALLIGLSGFLCVLADCLAAFLMCAIAFWGKRQRLPRILQITAAELLVSLLMGGVMTALYSLLNRLHLPFELLEGDGPSVWIFLAVSALAGWTTARSGRFLGFAHKTKSVTIRARVFGKPLTLRALVDSGNLLCDPVSGKRVIVAEESLLLPLLPSALQNACRGDPAAWISDRENARRVRPIPMHTANGSSLLWAIVPDSLIIEEGDEDFPSDFLLAPAPLGEKAAGFDALVGAD